MIRYLSADMLYPISRAPIAKGVVALDQQGIIVGVGEREAFKHENIEEFEGILIPGFINTHCHLELSHLKNKVPSGTGLLPFLEQVVKFRDTDPEEIQMAIRNGDLEMYNNGIQAVGDISNQVDTFDTKRKSKIAYFTFIEMFDFMQDALSEQMIEPYRKVLDRAPAPFSASPHAPYTVSSKLFESINVMNAGKFITVSIHNQETPPENELFESATGDFFDFYKKFGFNIEHLIPNGKGSIYYYMQHGDASQRTLFVHNTLTTSADIEAAQSWSEHVYWATCANANLYIENRLPDYQAFIESDAKLTIGTDSLSSNWQLSILEEIKTISKFNSFISFETILKWATLNGAEALGMEDRFGSFEIGKMPGVIHLNFNPRINKIWEDQIRISRIN